MIEKVNPAHPDKVADRIAGAIVDRAYRLVEDPRIAVEVLIGHETCTIITESSEYISSFEIGDIVDRITEGAIKTVKYIPNPQDLNLSRNQEGKIRCGDNGIFKGVPLTDEQRTLSGFARLMYSCFPYDGKYILDGRNLIICQSHASNEEIEKLVGSAYNAKINPLGYWTGGVNVDSGATNRKLGSDMAESITGGGLHGKDLSKADVSVNIYAFLKAQETGETVNLCCAIGDEFVDGRPYAEIVEIARKYIKEIGGFEKFAEWGLV